MTNVLLLVLIAFEVFKLFRSTPQNKQLSPVETINRMNVPKFHKKQGAIYIPPTDVEEARSRILEENQKNGIDTKLSDLYPDD